MDHGPGHDRHGRGPHARGHVARTRARGGRRMARRPGPRRRRGPAGRRHGPDHRGHMGRGPSRTQRARTTDGGPSTKGPGHERPPRDHRGHKRMAQTRPMQMGPVPAPRDPGMGGRVLLGPMPAPGRARRNRDGCRPATAACAANPCTSPPRDPCPTSAPTGAATGGTGSPAPGQVPAHGDHATNAAHGSIPAREANTAATHAARHMTTRRRAIGARCAPPPTPEPSKGSE